MACQCRLDVLLAEREADLPQIPRIRTHDLDLTCGQPAQRHETVEAIDLDGAAQRGQERALRLLTDVVGEITARHLDTYVVHPHLGGRIRSETEGPFVDGTHAQLVEQRQQIAERHRCAHSVHTEAPLGCRCLGEVHHRGAHTSTSSQQPIDDRQVDGRTVRPVQLVVASRYDWQESLEQCSGVGHPCGLECRLRRRHPFVGCRADTTVHAHCSSFHPLADDAVGVWGLVSPVCHRPPSCAAGSVEP